MLKKLSTTILFCLISAFVFAQTAPRQVLSEQDINNFITNYDKIMQALNVLESKYDYLLKEIGTDFESMIKIRTIEMPPEIQNILRANGLGNNGFEKVMVIIQGLTVLQLEGDLNMLLAAGSPDPMYIEYLNQSINSLKPLKDSINSRDLALLNNRKTELFQFLFE